MVWHRVAFPVFLKDNVASGLPFSLPAVPFDYPDEFVVFHFLVVLIKHYKSSKIKTNNKISHDFFCKEKPRRSGAWDSFAEVFGVVEDGRVDEVALVALVGFQDGFHGWKGGEPVALPVGLGLAGPGALAAPAVFLSFLRVHFLYFCAASQTARKGRVAARPFSLESKGESNLHPYVPNLENNFYAHCFASLAGFSYSLSSVSDSSSPSSLTAIQIYEIF